MSEHWNNLYTQYITSDNALCMPVLPQEKIGAILLRTQQIAEALCVFHATWTLSPRQTGQSERSDAGVVFYS